MTVWVLERKFRGSSCPNSSITLFTNWEAAHTCALEDKDDCDWYNITEMTVHEEADY